jgi:hypothetical protein
VEFANHQLVRLYIMGKIKGQFLWPFGQPPNLEKVLAAFSPISNHNIVIPQEISSPKHYFLTQVKESSGRIVRTIDIKRSYF